MLNIIVVDETGRHKLAWNITRAEASGPENVPMGYAVCLVSNKIIKSACNYSEAITIGLQIAFV